MELNRKTMLACLGGLCVAAIAAIWWSYKAEPRNELATAPVVVGDLEQKVLAVGRLRAKELVAVGAQVSGRVTKLYVKLGQQVKAGELIAQVDSQPQQIALRNAEAAVNSLRAQLVARRTALAQAELTFKRQQELLQAEAASRADYELAEAALYTARSEVDALRAQVDQARTQVDTARINLGYTQIVAPMDGSIVAVVTKQGQTLNSFQTTPTIVMLAKLDVMTVRAEIAEADVGKVMLGQTVWFMTLGDNRQRYTAKIEAIEPAPESIVNDAGISASQVSGTVAKAVYYNALFDVPNLDGRLRPSMTAQVSVLVNKVRHAVLVPVAALGRRDGDETYSVRVIDGRGHVETRQVRIGVRTNAQAQVLSGLEPGEQVVIGEAAPSANLPVGSMMGL